MDPAGEVTRLLAVAQAGDRQANDELYALVYHELRRVARRQLGRELPGGTLVTTALVHEAYLKLAGQSAIAFEGRAHFFGIAARAMRQVLVDHARARKADKRGRGEKATNLSGHDPGFRIPVEEMLALDTALDRLAELDERLRQVVEYRFFGGFTNEEIAGLLGLTERTVERDWSKARAWLHRELYRRDEAK
jgi:RNA polymerase sigma factor (TIGR02999 family)